MASAFQLAGCDVYTKIVDSGQGPVDQVVIIDGKLYGVQVKTVLDNGKSSFSVELRNGSKKTYKENDFDLLCVARYDGAKSKLFMVRWPVRNKYALTFNEERQEDHEFYKQLATLR